MISFIVIGKNEGQRLTNCLTSIYKVIKEDNITDYEIIYVDSKSTDNSIERAKYFKRVNIYEISGKCNAAIARNIGANEAKGDVLFFIDGDMEILQGFLPLVLGSDNQLIYPFMSGIFDDYIYDENWNFIKKERRYKLTEGMPDSFEVITGGLFLIETILWKSVGGMDNRFNQCEDMDLGLRLSQKGYPLLRKPILLAFHHTLAYLNIVRKKRNFSSSISSALLSRKQFFNPRYSKLFVRTQYSAIILFLTILFVVAISPISLIIIAIVWILRSYKMNSKSNLNLFESIWLFFYRDCVFLWAFFCVYHRQINLEYKQLI